MLKHRLLTALFLLPITVLAILFLPSLYFALLIAAIVAVAGWEWAALSSLQDTAHRITYVVALILGLVLANWIVAKPILWVAFAVWIWALAAVWCYQRERTPLGFQSPALQINLGFLMLVPMWVAIIVLRESKLLGPAWFLLVLCIIWAADTGAYFAGRMWGKHSLASRVSPKKTWEGFFGGLVLAMIIAVIGSLFFPLTWGQRIEIWILALIASLFSVLGDLTVSMLKRISGVKDSGQILPGHGGVLDRIDSVASASIIFALGSLLLGL